MMEYYQYLKRDFEAGDQQHCNLMVHVGLQRDGYWCFSEEVYGALNQSIFPTFSYALFDFLYAQLDFLYGQLISLFGHAFILFTVNL